VLLALLLLLAGCGAQAPRISLDQVPVWSGDPYTEVEGGVPGFTEEDRREILAEEYSELDLLGRCGQAVARVGLDTMPTEERGAIGQVKPTGWHLVKYDVVDGKYLYNRCHLIGFQLTGENADQRNLITGTRYLNVKGMLPFEDQVADYVRETGNHVLYRVTPIFEGSELVARGVQMEGWSVEDRGAGVCFNVYVYNVQPGVTIDYATGDSWLEEEDPVEDGAISQPQEEDPLEDGATYRPQDEIPIEEGAASQLQGEAAYILNNRSMRFHLPDCSGAASIKPKNRAETTLSRQELLDQGYVPCGQCKP